MPTPSLSQARRQYARQAGVVAAGIAAIRRLFASRPKPTIPQIASTAGGYQMAAALVSTRTVAGYVSDTPDTLAQAFMGVSSYGFSLAEPIIATIDRHVPAPVEPLPDPWWDDAKAFMADLEQLLASEIADAGRTASQVEFVSRPEWQNYVRMLTPPSCARCAILAGRIYRDLDSFQRHPQCDCVMVPVQDWQDAHDKGLVVSPDQAFENGDIRGLSKADARAVADGADLQKIVNATRGIQTVDIFGRTGVKVTTEGTTKRAAWRKANPSPLVRLRPESIYQFARDREDAIRLLRLYGYIT